MSDDNSEARALHHEWARLQTEQVALVAETVRLRGSTEADALHAHLEKLQRHAQDLRALTVAMERFHERTGHAIGALDQTPDL